MKIEDVNPEYEKSRWDIVAVNIMFSLIKSKATITADDYILKAKRQDMNPFAITRTAGILFKTFKTNGFIRKTNQFKLSERTSKPLPIYETCPNKAYRVSK